MDIAVAHAAAGTDWDALTAIGTLALAAVTLLAIMTTIVVTVQDRRRTDQRLSREREQARLEQQESDAWEVQIRLAQWPTSAAGGQPGEPARTLVATILNMSRRAIKAIEARFSLDSVNVIGFRAMNHLPAKSVGRDAQADTTGFGDALAPGMGMQITSEPVKPSEVDGPYPIVRWTDMQGQRWEWRKGEVERIPADKPWAG